MSAPVDYTLRFRPRNFPEKLIERHLRGEVHLAELLEADIDASLVLRLRMVLARAGSPDVPRFDDLCAALREASLVTHDTGEANEAVLRYAARRDENVANATFRAYEIMIEMGGCYSPATLPPFVRNLGPYRIKLLMQDRALLALGPPEAPRFPAAQFRETGHLVRGIDRVALALGERTPAFIFMFLMTPNDELGGDRPMEALNRSDVEPVLRAARHAVFV